MDLLGTQCRCLMTIRTARRLLNSRQRCLKAFVLPGGPLLPLTPPLPGMPAIVESFSDDFRSLYQNDFRLFTVKTFGHLSDRCKKIKRYEAFMMGHYIPNKVFVSGCGRQG